MKVERTPSTVTISDEVVTVKRNEIGMVFEFDTDIQKIFKGLLPERRVYPAVPPKLDVKKGAK